MNIETSALIMTSDLVDTLMARSALRGEASGTVRILGDNDAPALERVLHTHVPRALQSLGLTWSATPTGWAVDIPPTCTPLLTEYILDRLEQGNSIPPPHLRNNPRIQPCSY